MSDAIPLVKRRVCADCIHFIKLNNEVGECLRYPPTIFVFPVIPKVAVPNQEMEFNRRTFFPCVSHECPQCGEFQPKGGNDS